MAILRTRSSVPFLIVLASAALLLGASKGLLGVCGPFTDVSDPPFCPFVLEIFYQGITTGTTPTTYDPAGNVTRLQMAAFLSRSVDRVLQKSSRRAATDKYWIAKNEAVLGLTKVGTGVSLPRFDGQDLWVPSHDDGTVSRVRASDGKLLETWTGATDALSAVLAMGRVVIAGHTGPGNLYVIDPTEAPGAVTTVATDLGVSPQGIAFDGAHVWTANIGDQGSVSIVTPAAVPPWTVTTVTAGFATGFNGVQGIVYDGANMWVTDANRLLKLDAEGAILQTVTVGSVPIYPFFDGTNIWVPNSDSNSISVVRASNGVVLQTLTGNGTNFPLSGAFDGERVLIVNVGTDGVSLWKAADLTPLGFVSTGIASGPFGAATDGANFWITLSIPGKLARF